MEYQGAKTATLKKQFVVWIFIVMYEAIAIADTNSSSQNGQFINKTSGVPTGVNIEIKSNANTGVINGVVVDQTKSQQKSSDETTSNHSDFILKVLDTKVASGIISVLAGVIGFFFGKWYDHRKANLKEIQRYRSCLQAAENELRFYNDKLHQASGELGKLINDINQSNGTQFIIPSYSFYPDFLQNIKIELAGFFQNAQFVKDIGNCHFELCHIVERFNWVKDLANQTPLFILTNVGNVDGVKGLIDRNETTFQNSADKIKTEISRLDLMLGSN